jgi:2-oxoglutarate ferredoxin oxidoreductase subunit beta
MHDGSLVRFTRVPDGYDPTDRESVERYLDSLRETGEIATGLLYVDPDVSDMHALANTSDRPLARIPYEELCPGSAALDKLQESFR